jgi:glucose/arabinose dehydrogenase
VRHNGGRILFVPDGSMFVATGENDKGAPAQDPSSLLGKVLHLFPDGRPAPGNVEGYVYSLGHRNMYGLAYDAATKRLFATENGNAERDEVNLIVAGGNYGWPACEGFVRFDFAIQDDTSTPCDDPRYKPPIGEFYANRTAAPTGAAVLRGTLYWASWNEGTIHRMVEDPGTGAWKDDVVFRTVGRINDLEAGLDGASIYYSNWTHILRLDIPVAAVDPSATVVRGSPGLAFGVAALAVVAVFVWRRR